MASRRSPIAPASETDITSISCSNGAPSAPLVSTVMEMCGFLHSSFATVPLEDDFRRHVVERSAVMRVHSRRQTENADSAQGRHFSEGHGFTSPRAAHEAPLQPVAAEPC